jgi:deazaflavin-dependent oxidoreductase (nitroreductase family)
MTEIDLTLDGGMLILGSYAGAPKDPAWVHDLRANPHARIEVGTAAYDVDVRELPPEEREAAFPKITEFAPVLAEHHADTTRKMTAVRPTGPTCSNSLTARRSATACMSTKQAALNSCHSRGSGVRAGRRTPRRVSGLPRLCLGCGEDIASGSRCRRCRLPCTPQPSASSRGYDHRWTVLRRLARKLQPWCSTCFAPDTAENPLTVDHTPEAWAKIASGKRLALSDFETGLHRYSPIPHLAFHSPLGGGQGSSPAATPDGSG